jgi:hypothetical protein
MHAPGSFGWGPIGYDGIVAWVKENPDKMPTTLSELSTFPIAFRRVIVNMVSVEHRTAMWREHLESFLGGESKLDEAQRRLVADAIAQLPTLFGSERPVLEQGAKALEDRMREVLTPDQAFWMFGMIGPPEPPGGLPLPAGAKPVRRV